MCVSPPFDTPAAPPGGQAPLNGPDHVSSCPWSPSRYQLPATQTFKTCSHTKINAPLDVGLACDITAQWPMAEAVLA